MFLLIADDIDVHTPISINDSLSLFVAEENKTLSIQSVVSEKNQTLHEEKSESVELNGDMNNEQLSTSLIDVESINQSLQHHNMHLDKVNSIVKVGKNTTVKNKTELLDERNTKSSIKNYLQGAQQGEEIDNRAINENDDKH